jgi:hypothetical protein
MKARHFLAAALFATLTFSCASSSDDGNSPNAPEVSLIQSNSPDTMYLRGPIELDYVLVVDNKSGQPLRLTRLDLQTIGSGGYSLRTGASPMNHPVAPTGTTNVKVSAWGEARGGFLASNEPVTIRAVAYFMTPSGSTIRRVFTQVLAEGGH